MALVTCRECKTQISSAATACPNCGAKRKPKTSVFTWLLLGFAIVVVISNSGRHDRAATELPVPTPSPDQTAAAQQAAAAEQQAGAAEAQRTVDRCRAEYEKQKQFYAALIAAKKPWEAATEIHACAIALNDAELLAMVAKAEIQTYVQELKSANTARDKLNVLERLIRAYPTEAAPYASMRSALVARIEADAKAEERKRLAEEQREARAEAARRKREGVTIGMTMDEVRASSWGRPRSINRTTTSFREHEQWVYDGGYLYFENGTLTAIQN